MHIVATAALRTLPNEAETKSARKCCTAMNLHEAIVLPNPLTV
jgi:hypothetical protein